MCREPLRLGEEVVRWAEVSRHVAPNPKTGAVARVSLRP